MKTTKYLYGCEIDELPNNDEALVVRIDKAKKLLDSLLEVPIKDRDFNRIKDIVEAISFNQKLLRKEI